MDKLSIRKEAARIAAQVEGVTTRNFTATARRIEHYIMGSRNSRTEKEQVSISDQNKEDNTQSISPKEGLARLVQSFDMMLKSGNPKPNQTISNQVTATDRRIHDPAFVSDLMNTFANYPATKEDFNQAVRRRHELYHDLGLEPEPFDKRHPHPPCDTGQETVYLAPGGMPSSEAESIYLQENGDKVE